MSQPLIRRVTKKQRGASQVTTPVESAHTNEITPRYGVQILITRMLIVFEISTVR
jgi:hypothetical protein